MAYTLSLIGGRWKPGIICQLMNGRMRYSELKKSLPGISERMLVAQLRELEKDQIVQRIVHPEVPPGSIRADGIGRNDAGYDAMHFGLGQYA